MNDKDFAGRLGDIVVDHRLAVRAIADIASADLENSMGKRPGVCAKSPPRDSARKVLGVKGGSLEVGINDAVQRYCGVLTQGPEGACNVVAYRLTVWPSAAPRPSSELRTNRSHIDTNLLRACATGLSTTS